MRIRCLVFMMLVVTTGAYSQSRTPLAGSVHFAYQKIGGPSMQFVDCKQEGGACRHNMDRGAYVLAAGDGARSPVSEIAGYFGPDKPGAAQATLFMMASMKLFSPSVADRARGEALQKVVDSAAATRRGEVLLGGVKYVLRSSDGNDIRVYVTLP
jgi:hypothetical protein